uniref:Phospholipase B1, membrane-associated n=1 Tax=Parascaris univalens TaxID=6257 RepID=A0A915BXW4_PARUN
MRLVASLFVVEILYALAFDGYIMRYNSQRRRLHKLTKRSADSDEDDASDSQEDLNDRFHSAKEVLASNIASSFFNKRSFACPRARPTLHTGDSTADLSPEDIDIIAALGDSLSTGRGLWQSTDIEFRGAAFSIGGDANIDGLVTIPNILLEFNERVLGVSHGMGTRDQLPDDQLNCAQSGATSKDMPEQANELIRRLNHHHGKKNLKDSWLMLLITIGTEELCSGCSLPDYGALHSTMKILADHIPKVFVVLIGPVHVSFSHILTSNLLRSRCECLDALSKVGMRQLLRGWAEIFYRLQSEHNSPQRPTFGLLALPSLTITSRHPESLFIKNRPFLNRKGHTYAAKWLWNRLMTGPEYNLSEIVLSADDYFCPSMDCPYFRTVTNRHSCRMLTENEWRNSRSNNTQRNEPKRKETLRQHLVLIVVIIIVSAFISVAFFGTVFYRHGLQAAKSRFEAIPGV